MDLLVVTVLIFLLAVTSVSFAILLYQLASIKKALQSAMQICKDAVVSLRNGKG